MHSLSLNTIKLVLLPISITASFSFYFAQFRTTVSDSGRSQRGEVCHPICMLKYDLSCVRVVKPCHRLKIELEATSPDSVYVAH